MSNDNAPLRARLIYSPSVLVYVIVLAAIAFGVNWTAYESHIANQGVAAMASAISNERGVAPREQQAPRESF